MLCPDNESGFSGKNKTIVLKKIYYIASDFLYKIIENRGIDWKPKRKRDREKGKNEHSKF